MEDMLKEFVVEALELATNVEEHLLSLERNPDDMQTLNAVFRSFHTIKGGAGFMNLTAMVSACHLTENLFDALRTGKAPVTPVAIDAALQASGFVADQLNQLADGCDPGSLQPMPGALEQILMRAIDENAVASPASSPVAAVVLPSASSVASSSGITAEGKPDWQAFYLAVLPSGMAAPALSQSSEATTYSEPVSQALPGPDTGERKSNPEPGAKQSSGSIKEESIRIDASKLDALLEVAGESVQAANQASVLLEKLSQFHFESDAAALVARLAETLSRASRYSTELQRATLSTRMQPVGRLFQRFPRLVRELAKDLGKDVELIIEGAETEVDRVVVDSLYDPLVHMLRNSLDHGIESTEKRAASGKPAKANITLKAWQEGSSVMIELSDDGKGMDPNELRNKARAKGLITETMATTDEEAYQLVFLPGFSTKEVANNVSGRGVGMDVVKTAVEKHRGTIRITSALGKGTCFSIKLPIELSIVPTLLVRTAGTALAMPMAAVERVVELPDTFAEVGGSPVMRDQGRPLSVLSLAGVLGYTPGTERVGIVMAANQPYILAVGAIEGTADLVIKPLTALPVTGIAGTARSAEGELVLVISLSYLLDGCKDTHGTQTASLLTAA
jgi:two-component system chemotaxis sensor kinase CheA